MYSYLAINCRPFARTILIIGLLVSSHLVSAQLMFHADKSVQQGCEFRMGERSFLLSTYLLPDTESRSNVWLETFCNTIPKTGQIRLTIDLATLTLRNYPIGVQLLRRSNDGQPASGTTLLLDLTPEIYSTGVITFEYRIEQPGSLQLVLSVNDNPDMPSQFVIPLFIGPDYAAGFKMPLFVGMILLILLGLGLWYRDVRLRK